MCAGAVFGGGFASGRETISFFTQYGRYGWWLIVLSVGVMVLLALTCMRETAKTKCECWCGLYDDLPKWQSICARVCAMMMMVVTGGAMLSAAGHMVELLWPWTGAYAVGLVGTALLAWLAGHGRMRLLSWISAVLSALMLAAVLAVLAGVPSGAQNVTFDSENHFGLWAALRAVAYAAMNMTLAIGVVCRCSRYSRRGISRTAILLGFLLLALLFVSQYLYLRHSEIKDEVFPIVKLLSAFGRGGFLLSVILLYLAVFTTLAAVLYGLRTAVEGYVRQPWAQVLLWLGLPLAISCIGFSEIVNRLYAPAGLGCLVLVFGPVLFRRFGKNSLDNQSGIQ